MKAVLFKSRERFQKFQKVIEDKGIQCIPLDFGSQEWVEFDFSDIDFLIYYPSFKYSSNSPLALYEVQNLLHIYSEYPRIEMYPDPKLIEFYNDKYRQYLFLKHHNYPIPETYPLFSEDSLKFVEEKLGYPMVIKNRYGAGGYAVFMVLGKEELNKYYRMSTLNLFNRSSIKYLFSLVSKRLFYYHLIKAKRMVYPFLSPPLLAQKFIKMDRDLKTVIGNSKVIEAHWRIQANEEQWKVNIDGGGIGEWSKIPEEAIHLSERLANHLRASWLNIDIIPNNGKYLITEFSPVWHHYAYKEKPTFVYRQDYNIDTPLEISLNLEKIIVESLMKVVTRRKESGNS